MEAVTRKQALSVILELFECHFGSEKGSGDMYAEFMERMGLSVWDDECEKCIKEPPGEFEFLLALGVQPQEFYDLMPGLNPRIFDDLMELYHLTPPAERKEDGQQTNTQQTLPAAGAEPPLADGTLQGNVG